MRKVKEPDFMQELHKVREKLSRRWSRLSAKEMLESLSESGKWLKSHLRSSSIK